MIIYCKENKLQVFYGTVTGIYSFLHYVLFIGNADTVALKACRKNTLTEMKVL